MLHLVFECGFQCRYSVFTIEGPSIFTMVAICFLTTLIGALLSVVAGRVSDLLWRDEHSIADDKERSLPTPHT